MLRTRKFGVEPVKDLLCRYMEEVSDSHPLSGEEEAALAARIQSGDLAARDRLVRANLKFVIRVAQAYQDSRVPLADLVGAGNLGLITAAERFDGTRGFKFITYAVWWIRQAVFQAVSEYGYTVRLPLNRLDLIPRIARSLEARRQNGDDSPDLESVAEELGISTELLVDTLIKGRDALSLDATDENHDKSLKDLLADEAQESPDERLMRDDVSTQIACAMKTLEAREREVIASYFGLDGGPRMTLKELGMRFGVSRERMRQIKDQALVKLRDSRRIRSLDVYL